MVPGPGFRPSDSSVLASVFSGTHTSLSSFFFFPKKNDSKYDNGTCNEHYGCIWSQSPRLKRSDTTGASRVLSVRSEQTPTLETVTAALELGLELPQEAQARVVAHRWESKTINNRGRT